jgi:hypothetical protein
MAACDAGAENVELADEDREGRRAGPQR